MMEDFDHPFQITSQRQGFLTQKHLQFCCNTDFNKNERTFDFPPLAGSDERCDISVQTFPWLTLDGHCLLFVIEGY